LNLLALDTSSEWCSAALLRGGVITFRETHAVQRHSELILPMLHELLDAAGLTVHQLDAVAFGAGPGSFTGLRIACGVAQGLAFAAGLPVLSVVTLEAMAEAAGGTRVFSALDARMDEIYAAAYERTGDRWQCVLAPGLYAVPEAPRLDGQGWIGCGSAFALQGEALRQRYGAQLASVQPQVFAHAREMAAIASRMHERGEGVAAQDAAPLYVRDKVAMTMAERKAAPQVRA
jgi:tRNA threonylcarbamoyladenosine biosynthesis protein TsaB